MKRVGTLVAAALITLSAASMTYAIVGAGFHWGFDFSMSMEKGADSVAIPTNGLDLGANVFQQLPSALRPSFDPGDVISGATPLIISRNSELKRSWLNFGGKAYVDVVPFLEIIELSFNLGVWQYDGAVSYLDVNNITPAMLVPGNTERIPYKNVPLTLKEYNLNYFGLNETPYAKLQFDLSVRKTVLNLWLVKFNAGAGVSMGFSTPILSESLIEDVKADKGIKSPEELVAKFMDTKSGMGKAVVEKILDELFTPRWGAHIAAGANLKLPAIPLGIYIDGKLLIPITKFDENKQVNGLGFLVNTGISLSI
ncbi:MAG: hypothetical protein LBC59_04810 [Chitinispirillales bacterium]|jgi:hypothetical protein|nr:hypothetical protein [Chitinispirillales bacterium]